jgi:nucleoside-diphosphate-sugar epimerase
MDTLGQKTQAYWRNKHNMKVLVVGGRGFLGTVICNLMCEKHDVTSVDLGWFPTNLNLKIKNIIKNAFEIKSLKEYDSVIHVAGISNDPMAEMNPEETFSNNVGLTFYLAKMAKRDGVKNFIYASSCSVYGWKNKIVTEESEPETESYYGTSKLLGERISFLRSKDFKVTIFRMGTLSGASPRMRYDLLFNTMYSSAIKKGKIFVHDPNVYRPVLHVKEAAKVFSFASESSQLDGIYNLASFNCSVLEAAKKIQSVFGGEIEITNKKEIRNYLVDTLKINKIIPIESKPEDIIQDLKNLDRNIDTDDPIYHNIKTYKNLKK